MEYHEELYIFESPMIWWFWDLLFYCILRLVFAVSTS